MTHAFDFVGNLGKNTAQIQQVLTKAKIAQKRMPPAIECSKEMAANPPLAIVFGQGVDNMEQIIAAIREERSLFSVPILTLVSAPSSEYLDAAFRFGIDDYIVESSTKQFKALVSTLTNEESWGGMRAPAGKVILAHAERSERVRLGKVLRRNGYDIFFVASTDELENAVTKVDARAVVASADLPGDSVVEVMTEVTDQVSTAPPWVLIAPPTEVEELSSIAPRTAQTSFFQTGTDAEGLTFVMNEMLAPPYKGTRKSPRVLYGAPISFRPLDEETHFFGFTFNINLGGLYIRTLTGLPLQTRMEVAFKPPHGRGQTIAHAQVVWRKKLGDTEGNASPPGMGIQFIDMQPADAASFETGYELLRKEIPQEIPPQTNRFGADPNRTNRSDEPKS